MNRKAILISLGVIMLLMLACSSGGNDTQLEATRLSLGIQQTQNALIQETINAATAQAAAPTEQPPTQEPPTPLPQPTLAPPTAEPPTAEPQMEQPSVQDEPAQEDQFARIAKYVRADAADYYTMADVKQTWNEKDSFWQSLSGEEAGNFVISAKVSWSAPQDMAEPARYGCGFIYGLSDPKHFHVTVVSPDQKVHTFRKRGGEEIEMKGGDVPGGGLGTYSGEAELLLAVEEKVMTAYVNDMQIVMFNDPYIDFGKMGLAINNGSYSGFTCNFTNVELWILK